jgi:glutathione synthase/RimK-type ligase-like ATP-grasp enzyme
MTRPLSIALATCSQLPEPDPDQDLTLDALRAAGADAWLLAWDAPLARHDADLVVLRSTWDYHARIDDFLAWADAIGARLVNPPRLVRWNAHKRYLEALAAMGVPVVPTVFFDRGRARGAEVAAALAAKGWRDVVVKPAVSAGSFSTRRFTGELDEPWVDALLAARDVMVQPYVKSVEGHGERAVVTIDGEVTHAVRKSPRFSGEAESVSEALEPDADERAVAARSIEAARTLAKLDEPLLYGRVDLVRDDAGRPMVGELELLEPSLFFAQNPGALARFVRATLARAERLRTR